VVRLQNKSSVEQHSICQDDKAVVIGSRWKIGLGFPAPGAFPDVVIRIDSASTAVPAPRPVPWPADTPWNRTAALGISVGDRTSRSSRDGHRNNLKYIVVGLPTKRRRRLPLPVFRCSCLDPDDVGFVPGASFCRAAWLGISAVPSSGTTSGPPVGIRGCNTARMLAEDEIVADILSVNSNVFVAAEPGALDFSLVSRGGEMNFQGYSWRDVSGSSCLGQDADPLRSAVTCRFTGQTSVSRSTGRQS